jgi:hypothetical protein
MKRLLTMLLLCLSGLLTPLAHAQGMVTLSMGQPGFYGRIDMGTYTEQPPLIFPNALMGNPGVFSGQPIYMHVPPQHAHYWSSHCHRYGACDWMVYFVDNNWYSSVYVPGFRSGVFSYAPAPVYYAPPIYAPRPYYGHHHHHHGHHHARPPHHGGHGGHHHHEHRPGNHGHNRHDHGGVHPHGGKHGGDRR